MIPKVFEENSEIYIKFRNIQFRNIHIKFRKFRNIQIYIEENSEIYVNPKVFEENSEIYIVYNIQVLQEND